jgi:hypothetical protein
MAQAEKIVVICGMVRDTLEFAFIMDRLVKHRAEGLLDRIILSTWINGIDRDGPLFQLMAAHRIELIESISPENGGYGNIHRQKKALLQALLQLPPDATVLKLRTDKCAVLIDRFIERMKAPLVRNEDPASVYSHKVVVVRTSSTLPFMNDDFAFLGTRDDLLKMTAHEESLRIINPACDPTAEMLWMYAALARRDPYLDTFFSLAAPRVLSVHVKNAARAGVETIPHVVMSFLAHYWHMNAANYEVLGRRPAFADAEMVTDILVPWPVRNVSRDLGQYITVFAEGAIGGAARHLRDLRTDLLRRNPVEVVLALNEFSEQRGKPVIVKHHQIGALHVDPTPEGSLPQTSFINAALRSHPYAPQEEEERLRVESVINAQATRTAFPRLLGDIGVMYRTGTNDLPVNETRSRAWLRYAAEMKEPFAFKNLVETYPSLDEAIADVEVQRLFAMQETRDPETYVSLSRIFLTKNMSSKHIDRSKMLRTLDNLAMQGGADAQHLLQELQDAQIK